MQLVNGNALAARLGKSAMDLGVRLLVSSPATHLCRRAARCAAPWCRRPTARCGSSPGAAWCSPAAAFRTNGPQAARCSATRRQGANTGRPRRPATPATGCGSARRSGGVGGSRLRRSRRLGPGLAGAAPRRQHRHLSAIVERGKPGVIAVPPEACASSTRRTATTITCARCSRAVPEGEEVTAWLICDHRFQRRYGLGYARPSPMPLGPHLRSGYLNAAPRSGNWQGAAGSTLPGWRRRRGDTIATPATARTPRSGAAATPYNRIQGDPDHAPTPASHRSARRRSTR